MRLSGKMGGRILFYRENGAVRQGLAAGRRLKRCAACDGSGRAGPVFQGGIRGFSIIVL